MKEPSQADLIRKRLMSVHMCLFATQGYLDRFGTPQTPKDLADHRLICQNPRSAQVGAAATLVAELMTNSITTLLSVNNYYGVLQGVKHKLGIGVLPDYLAQDVPELVRVLPETKSVEVPVFLAYPEELRHSKRISAFRDFVQEEIVAYRKIRRQLQND